MRRAILALLMLAAAAFPAAAQEEFYKGKTLRIIVGSATGGGYDAYARLMSRHMAKHLPGNPTIIVMNMPGADGIISANHLFNIADKDGTVIGTFNRFIVLMQLLGNDAAKFKVDEFNWLGTTASYSENSYLVIIRAALPHKTIADMRNPATPLHIGNVDADVPMILQDALGLAFKVVSGYKGKDDLELAFNRGEVDATSLGWSSIQSRHSNWLKSGFIRPMIQFGRIDRLAELKDVPTARELARTPEDRALVEFAELPLITARPFAAPPGLPAERVALLRKAFMQTMADPGYVSEGKKQKLELTPKSGEEMQKMVAGLSSATPSVVARYKKALGGRVGGGG